VSIISFNTYVADGSDEGGVGFLIPAKTSPQALSRLTLRRADLPLGVHDTVETLFLEGLV
jgi:hypothetical protein